MSNCCLKASSHKKICPECAMLNQHVSMKTIFHQVRFPEVLNIINDHYFFCANNTCSIGYFSEQGHTISQQTLRSFNDLKNNQLCYCFDISSEQYINALKGHHSAELIRDFIVQKTTSGNCACEIRNPSGKCCLPRFK